MKDTAIEGLILLPATSLCFSDINLQQHNTLVCLQGECVIKTGNAQITSNRTRVCARGLVIKLLTEPKRPWEATH